MQQEREKQTHPQTQEPASNQHQIAENPNPRANENITHAPFEEKGASENAVGTEITDGEAG